MDDRITIIEGPPPVFENVNDEWAVSLSECPSLYDMAITRLRTFNGPALVERCHKAWNSQGAMYLHYKNPLGLEERSSIMAARSVESADGHVLLLWVRRLPEESETQFDPDDDDDSAEN
jgi:hypothetical protein